MTAVLIALIPVAGAVGFLAGARYAAKAVRTTDGRHRFGGYVHDPSAPPAGDVHIHNHAGQAEPPVSFPPPVREDPPTVGLRRVDGTTPVRR